MDGTETNSAGDHLGLLDRALGVDCWRHSHTYSLYLWTRSSRQGGDKNFMLIVIIIMFIISDLWFSFLGSVSPSDLLHICGDWLPHPPHWHHLQCQAALWYSGHHHHHWNPKRSKGGEMFPKSLKLQTVARVDWILVRWCQSLHLNH